MPEPKGPPELVNFTINPPGGAAGLGAPEEQRAGYLWLPRGNGPWPAVLFNHGSEKLPGSLPDIGSVLVRLGYAFFVPHRRGHGKSAGTWIGDVSAPGQAFVDQMVEQLTDQRAGLEYLKTRAEVDPSRIAVAGSSYGGIQTVLALGGLPGPPAYDFDYQCAVAFAVGSYTWDGNQELRTALTAAIATTTIPVFLIQAAGDHSLAPTLALAQALATPARQHLLRASIYPQFGSSKNEAHAFAIRGTSLWILDVLRFLQQAT